MVQDADGSTDAEDGPDAGGGRRDSRGDAGDSHVVVHTRVNFRFDPERFREREHRLDRIDGKVILRYYWKNAKHFHDDVAGFMLGIETLEAHRGNGYAQCVCARLIDYCLEHGCEPVLVVQVGEQGFVRAGPSSGFRTHYHEAILRGRHVKRRMTL
ncbi:MAG: GNAT family N-acetyltransferase [Thermoleophilia bacterium]|nr:GNAT family N-acetyltransferase [Thermoleophilia bacterium]